MQERFDALPAEYSHLYMAVDSVLAAVICIEDPLREDAADAVSDGAEIAREIADIMIGSDDLYGLVTLKKLSNALVRRIRGNYRVIVGFNTALILLGVGGFLQPASSALLHNTSTLAISLKSMQDLL